MENPFAGLPTPWEILTDPVSLIVLGIFGSLMLWEALYPAKPLPHVKYWKLKGLLAFVLYFFLSSYLPMLWNVHLAPFQLFDLTFLGTWGGVILALLIYELGLYLWHYSLHHSSVLWKMFHQMHHSAERLDSYGAFYFSPMDMLGFTFLGSLALVVVAGFTPEATTLFILCTTFLGIFQHSNIRTPVWIGYIVQRPESHSVHHGKGIHGYNYSDLAIFDIIFGTFKNPEKHMDETGFYLGASGKVGDMLLFKDISRPRENGDSA